MFKVVEKFVSINGEGKLAGQLAVFIRFAGCNLKCSYCDTSWANQENVKFELMDSRDIYEYIKKTEIKNITLTGGEPLMQEGILELLELLTSDNLRIEIETNGSIDLKPFIELSNPVSFTMDYKLPTSNMESKMCLDNFNYINKKDTVKFVIGSIDDLNKAKEVIDRYELIGRTSIYLSPVFGKIELDTIVDFMKNNKLNDVNLQIQMHKIIWDKDKRGV